MSVKHRYSKCCTLCAVLFTEKPYNALAVIYRNAARCSGLSAICRIAATLDLKRYLSDYYTIFCPVYFVWYILFGIICPVYIWSVLLCPGSIYPVHFVHYVLSG